MGTNLTPVIDISLSLSQFLFHPGKFLLASGTEELLTMQNQCIHANTFFLLFGRYLKKRSFLTFFTLVNACGRIFFFLLNVIYLAFIVRRDV